MEIGYFKHAEALLSLGQFLVAEQLCNGLIKWVSDKQRLSFTWN